MKIQVYNPNSLLLEQDDATGIDFGTTFQGSHCEEAIIIKPVATNESSFVQMKMALQNQGGLTKSSFGYYLNENLATGILPGSNLLSDHFDLNESPSITGEGVELDASNPEYVWMDVQAGDKETGSSSSVNFQFSFEYN